MRSPLRCLALALLVLFAACQEERSSERPDPHSFARPDEAVMEHLSLDLSVDFDTRELTGTAVVTVANPGQVDELWLDTDGLTIAEVRRDDRTAPAEWSLTEPEEYLGRGLRIGIGPDTRTVTVRYHSSADASALLWLEPEQTHGKTAPFLFSQSQSVYARSWIPCQDSPGVRFSYDARITVPRGLMAVMSAENGFSRNPDGVYTFTMPQPIPAYLLALAVGDFDFAPLSDRAGVFAEPGLLEASAWEFAQTEAMIEEMEALYGPYRWGRFDVLVLPPYFPFGGMENPRVTFATPTILAGDRSLVALIAHELAHSWSGNLVTSVSWEDFWLNEGFTVYLERRVMEAIEGPEYAAMLVELGYQDLVEEMELLGEGSSDMHLVLELDGRDPDDSFTDVAYEKGYFFLRLMEEAVGRDRFDPFLNRWFDRYAFSAVDTPTFLGFARAELFADDAAGWDALRVDEWVHGGAIPDNVPRADATEFARVEDQLAAWLAGDESAPDVSGWTTHHWLHFLRALPEDLTLDLMTSLDTRFQLSASQNSEILHEWLLTSVGVWYEPALPALGDFLRGMGRRKFLRPLYTALATTEPGQELARSIYRDARPNYHPLASRSLDPIVGWGE